MEIMAKMINADTDRCPVCKSNLIMPSELLPVNGCMNCDVMWLQKFTDNSTYVKDDEKTQKFFDIDKNDESRGKINTVRMSFLKLCQMNKNGEAHNLLDVGCGAGTFLDIAKEAGFKTFGIDISPAVCEYVKQKGHNCYRCMIDAFVFGDQLFSVITFFDTLEHALSPFKLMRRASKSLKSGGHVIVSTPLRPEKMTREWRHFREDEHNFYFNRKSLRYLLLHTGFIVINENTDESAVRVDPAHPENILTVIARKK